VAKRRCQKQKGKEVEGMGRVAGSERWTRQAWQKNEGGEPVVAKWLSFINPDSAVAV